MNSLMAAVTMPDKYTIRKLIADAEQFALHNPVAWGEALHDLPGQVENAIIFAVMDGDEAYAGKLLAQHLRGLVLVQARSRAIDDIGERFDMDVEVEYDL